MALCRARYGAGLSSCWEVATLLEFGLGVKQDRRTALQYYVDDCETVFARDWVCAKALALLDQLNGPTAPNVDMQSRDALIEDANCASGAVGACVKAGLLYAVGDKRPPVNLAAVRLFRRACGQPPLSGPGVMLVHGRSLL
jgi:hypothetical protein